MNPETNSEEEIELYVPEGFAVVDARTANWVVRKIKEARAHADNVAQWAEVEKARAKREEAELLARFGPALIAVVEAEIAEWNESHASKPRKSVNWPSGSAGFRSQPAGVRVDDEAIALEWAKEKCPDAVTTTVTERVSRTALNAHFERTGEVPSGCHFTQSEEKFFVR